VIAMTVEGSYLQNFSQKKAVVANKNHAAIQDDKNGQ
jgi:hypothetical protein